MSGSCKSKTPSGLSDVLRSRVEIDPRDIWKVLVKHVIAHKGHDIKKGHTNAWYTVLINVSAWVESRLCEEGMEITVCHRKSKWTIDTIDEVLVDYVDQDITSHTTWWSSHVRRWRSNKEAFVLVVDFTNTCSSTTSTRHRGTGGCPTSSSFALDVTERYQTCLSPFT